MKNSMTIEEAITRIEELESEIVSLKEELDYYKNKKTSGRKKHNDKWMSIYNDFVVCYERGMALVDIAERNGISERSMYRYKAYYEKLNK